MRLSLKGLSVLNLFLEDIRKTRSGAEISRELGIASGTLYPILARFEQNGLLESEWEQVDPTQVGRPRRRFYKITGAGQELASRESQAALLSNGYRNLSRGRLA